MALSFYSEQLGSCLRGFSLSVSDDVRRGGASIRAVKLLSINAGPAHLVLYALLLFSFSRFQGRLRSCSILRFLCLSFRTWSLQNLSLVIFDLMIPVAGEKSILYCGQRDAK